MIRDHGTVALATYMLESQYPYDKDPSRGLEALLELLGSHDDCTHRRDKKKVYEDEIFKTVREYISNK